MANLFIYILILVVTYLTLVAPNASSNDGRGSNLALALDHHHQSSASNSGSSNQQQQQSSLPSNRAANNEQRNSNNNNYLDFEQQQLRSLFPNMDLRALFLPVVNDREDYHSNIELDKVNNNDANRYEIVDGPTVVVGEQQQQQQQQPQALPAIGVYRSQNQPMNNNYNLAHLLSRMLSANKANEFLRNQVERKRNIRQQFASILNNNNKEDKDYSFIGQPMANVGQYHTIGGQQQQQQQHNNKWAEQKLRDMILANGHDFRYSTDSNQNHLDQLSQGDANSDFSVKNIEDLNFVLPKNREKRRRCKVDPNLGVKNPSFCDTDAYFGAADYSMRDVWNEAGR